MGPLSSGKSRLVKYYSIWQNYIYPDKLIIVYSMFIPRNLLGLQKIIIRIRQKQAEPHGLHQLVSKPLPSTFVAFALPEIDSKSH